MDTLQTSDFKTDGKRVHRASCDRLTGLAPYANLYDLTTKTYASCCRPEAALVAQTVARLTRDQVTAENATVQVEVGGAAFRALVRELASPRGSFLGSVDQPYMVRVRRDRHGVAFKVNERMWSPPFTADLGAN